MPMTVSTPLHLAVLVSHVIAREEERISKFPPSIFQLSFFDFHIHAPSGSNTSSRARCSCTGPTFSGNVQHGWYADGEMTSSDICNHSITGARTPRELPSVWLQS